MWPAMMLSMSTTSTFQLTRLPSTVTMAEPVAVVVTGVGRSFAPFRVAVKTSSPAGIPVTLSLQATPAATVTARAVNMRDARIRPPWIASFRFNRTKLRESYSAPFQTAGRLLNDDLPQHKGMRRAVVRKWTGAAEPARETGARKQ